MAKVSYEDLEKLASIIMKKIEEEFAVKKMSGNLVRTVEIKASADSIEISIPAPTYNMLEFQRRGAIVHTYHGSYASKLDKEGSEFFVYPNGEHKGSHKIYPRNHIGFVDRVIREAVDEWTAMNSNKYRKTKETDTGGQ